MRGDPRGDAVGMHTGMGRVDVSDAISILAPMIHDVAHAPDTDRSDREAPIATQAAGVEALHALLAMACRRRRR